MTENDLFDKQTIFVFIHVNQRPFLSRLASSTSSLRQIPEKTLRLSRRDASVLIESKALGGMTSTETVEFWLSLFDSTSPTDISMRSYSLGW